MVADIVDRQLHLSRQLPFKADVPLPGERIHQVTRHTQYGRHWIEYGCDGAEQCGGIGQSAASSRGEQACRSIRRRLRAIGCDVGEVRIVKETYSTVKYGLSVAEETRVRVPGKTKAWGDVVGIVLHLDDGINGREGVIQINRGIRKRVLRSCQIVVPQTGVDRQVRC